MKLTEKDLFVGGRYLANFRGSFCTELLERVFIPIKILAEYPRFFVVEVTPHRNPIRSWGMSTPYRMTIDKFNLKMGEIIVKDFGT